MPVKFDPDEEFGSLREFSIQLINYIHETRMGFSSAHTKCDYLNENENKTLRFSSLDLVCWCAGEYRPKENSKQKNSRQSKIFKINLYSSTLK